MNNHYDLARHILAESARVPVELPEQASGPSKGVKLSLGQRGEPGGVINPPSPPLIYFDCPCLPIAQPRQRHRAFVVGGKAISHNYTPAKHPVQGFKALLILAARKAWRKSPLTSPIRVDFTFRFPLPKSAKASIRKQVEAGEWIPHVSKPDADNVYKAAVDCLTGLIWADDRQIAEGRWRKVYDVTPGVEVMVWILVP